MLFKLGMMLKSQADLQYAITKLDNYRNTAPPAPLLLLRNRCILLNATFICKADY